MDFLYFLEGLRNPVCDALFAAITHLGEETVFIVLGLLFYWCINKWDGYYLLTVGLIGTVFNQFLKLWFRIPRPWVRDPNFTIVESARAEATGYSFPSGHTQSALGSFGSIARRNKQPFIRTLCIATCVLVPLSRMWLGVHTPADVLVSTGVALVLVFGLHPLMRKAAESKKTMRCLMGALVAVTVAFLVFVYVYPFPADIDQHNYESGLKNAYKMMACLLALWLSYEVDEAHTHFDTKAVWWAQILKLFVGLIPILLIKIVLKTPLQNLIGDVYIADGVRYFLLTAFAGCVWPMTFRFWNRLGNKK
ncbi:MAG: phosphatase PAP2 family protein [Clostridia bacterium]|nr:phosphatase PAP2 family protein [Clostridia bacterium]